MILGREGFISLILRKVAPCGWDQGMKDAYEHNAHAHVYCVSSEIEFLGTIAFIMNNVF